MRLRPAVALLLIVVTAGVPVALADPDPSNDHRDPYFNEDEYTAFYTPPEPLPPGQPGAIMATGTRIMYRSTDARGNPMAVTGTYFEPFNAWPGQG